MGSEKRKTDTQGTKVRKEYVKLDLSIHERPTEPTRKLSGPRNILNKVLGHKMN